MHNGSETEWDGGGSFFDQDDDFLTGQVDPATVTLNPSLSASVSAQTIAPGIAPRPVATPPPPVASPPPPPPVTMPRPVATPPLHPAEKMLPAAPAVQPRARGWHPNLRLIVVGALVAYAIWRATRRG